MHEVFFVMSPCHSSRQTPRHFLHMFTMLHLLCGNYCKFAICPLKFGG